MKVRHDEKTDNSNDDAPELHFFVGSDTVRHVVGNRLIKKYHAAACNEDD